MQAEINGLMMAKKNSAVLWTVDQTGDVIGKEGRTTAQGNVGLGSAFVKSAKTDNAYVTHVSRDSTTSNLVVNTKQPELSELKGLNVDNKDQSIITDSQGNIVNQALSDTQKTAQNTTTSFVSAVTQNGNGSVVVTTSDITSAAVGTSGIVPLIADITDVNDAIITNKEDHAVTPLGVKDAIDTLNVSDSAVSHKYVSSVSESNGKISVSREWLTLESINPEELHTGKTVGINATTGAIEPQDLGTVEILEGSDPTNRFVSSIDQASNGQISYTTQQLKVAASNSIGGIKIGYTEPSPNTDKQYAVKLDSEKAYVQVPWENTHYTSKNVICKSASGTDDTAVSTSESAYLNHVENGNVTDSHKISGSGITVAYNNTSKTLTLTSNSGTVTSISAGTGLTTDQTGGGAITSSGSISLTAAGDNALGGIKLGYTDSTVGTRNYAVNVDGNGKAYVNVPWTGTVTSIAAGTGLTTDQASAGAITSSGTISLTAAGNNALGGIKLGYDEPTPTVTNKKYAVKTDETGNNAGKAYVYVPWQDTHYTSYNIICNSATGTSDSAVTASQTAYLNHKDNGIVTSSHQILGNGIDVTADSSGNLTFASKTFYAEYGVATYQEVLDALNANKIVYTTWGAGPYRTKLGLAQIDNQVIRFIDTEVPLGSTSLMSCFHADLQSDNTWTFDQQNIGSGDLLPSHGSGDGNKILALSSDGLTPQWRNGFVPIYTDYTGDTSVVGWKIATTKVRTSDNHDSSSVSAWVTIRSRGATSNPRNQGTLFAGYMWINYRGNGTSTPTISTVFNSLTNYTNGWKLYRDQYTDTDSNLYVSDWYVCLPSTVQWIEITMHVLGTVGAITLCTERVSSIGSGWTAAIEASKTPYMLGAGGVGSNTSPVYIATDGQVTQCSTVDADTVDGLHFVLGSWSTDQNTISLL